MDCYSIDGEKAEDLEVKGFDKEKELQALVDRHRNVLPVDIPNRNVAVKEFLAIDNLILDSKADIYILEDKLARNTTKREVLSQALDYATELQKVPADEFLERLENRTGKDFVEEWFDESKEKDLFKEKLRYNLQKGFVTILIVMDEISEKLREKTRLVNRSSDYKLKLVEISPVSHEDDQLLFVNSYGEKVKSSISPPNREAISYDEFIDRKTEQGLNEQAVAFVSCIKTISEKTNLEIKRQPKRIGLKGTFLQWPTNFPVIKACSTSEHFEEILDYLKDAPSHLKDKMEFSKRELEDGESWGKIADIHPEKMDEQEIKDLVKFAAEGPYTEWW